MKVAAVDRTGKVVATDTIFPHAPRNDWEGALHALEVLVRQHNLEIVAVGNGTASRETDKLAADLIRRCPGLQRVTVSEAGASVYSASEVASQELPSSMCRCAGPSPSHGGSRTPWQSWSRLIRNRLG